VLDGCGPLFATLGELVFEFVFDAVELALLLLLGAGLRFEVSLPSLPACLLRLAGPSSGLSAGSFASSTLIWRPKISALFILSTEAAACSEVANSTKPYPRLRLPRVIITPDLTSPCFPNASTRAWSVVRKARLPTKTFVDMVL